MSGNQIVYMFSVVCFIVIVTSFRYGRYFPIVNLTVYGSYNLILYYNLFQESGAGTGLIWWFYLILCTSVQIVLSVAFLLSGMVKELQGDLR